MGKADAGSVVGAFERFAAKSFRSQGQDLETGQRALGVREVFSMGAGDVGNGVEHDRSGNGQLDEQAGQAEEAANGACDRGAYGVGATAANGVAVRVTESQRDAQAALKSSVDGTPDASLRTHR